MKATECRQLGSWKRAVIKVGSSLVAPEGKRISNTYTLDIAGFITECRNRGKEMILVTSGAVAAGIATQPDAGKRQLSIPEKQAMAAIGQPLLMTHWSKYFDFHCAQLLLTYQGINERDRFVNAKNTMQKLLEKKTLPIVNENDTVVVDEIKVGDNDNLAAHVAVLAEADILLICSDVNGLYEADPRMHPSAAFVHEVDKITNATFQLAGGKGTRYSTGGMITKIQAAEKATARGIDTFVFNGANRRCFQQLLEGKNPGTIFCKNSSPLTAKKHWMQHALKSKGLIHIDDGAQKAVIMRGASLLPSGIICIEGRFKQGDAVDVAFNNISVARGITQYSAQDLNLIKGVNSSCIHNILGYFYTDEVIHRNDLVLL